MEDGYDTMALEDTVVLESPIAESGLLNLDMGTEVLSVSGSAQLSEDRMGDNYCQKEIVLDSDEERGGQDEHVTLVSGRFPRSGRLFSRGETSLRKRQKVRAGCFRRLDKRVRRHAFLHTDRCNEGSNAGTTCLYSDSIFREHLGVMDIVLSTSPDQKPIATNAKECLIDQNIVKEKCFVDDSLDEKNVSSCDCKSIKTGKEANPLNYNESQEAAESHDKALGFVDHFLSISDLGSFNNVDLGKTNRISSPPSLRSKGSQCLARRVSLAHYASKSMAFDWMENHIENDEYTTLRMNEDKNFGFEGEKSERMSSIEESSNVNFQKKRISSLHSRDKLPGITNDLVTKSLNTNDTGKIGSNSGTFTAHDSIDAGLLRQEVNEGEDLSLTLEALDIGLDTQIAAEAMEELFNAAPPRIDPYLTHQGSDNTLLDSSNTVHTGSKLKNAANHEEAFVGWGCKEKRSRCMKMFTVRDKAQSFAVKQFELPLPVNKKSVAAKDFNSRNPGNSRNSNQRLRCLRGRRTKETTDRSKSGFPSKQRKTTDGVRESPFKVKTDISEGEENFNLDVADVTLSNPLWTYPKRKRSRGSRPCTVSPLVKLSNQYPPCAETENNVERTYPLANDEKNQRLSNLLVYNRRRKVSVERELVESSLEIASEKMVQFPGELGTAIPSRECGTLDGGEPSSFDSSNLLVYNRRRKVSVERELVESSLEIASEKTVQFPGELGTAIPSRECGTLDGGEPSSFDSSNLLVYNRRRKVSVEREQVESSLEFASEKLVQFPGALDTANPSRRCGTLDGGELSSFDSSNYIKSNVLLSIGHSLPLQVSESSEKSKQSFTHHSRSPLMKELTRLGYTESIPDFLPKDTRRRRDIKRVCILFSQNMEIRILKQQRKIVARLGFSIVSCCSEATHFVTDRFVRTRNMLEAIALGKQVVTHLWLESCEQAGYVIDEKSYILRDEKKEKEIGFNMLASLSRASQHPLLQGRRVLITPSVKPNVDAINSLVNAAGGKVVQSIQNPNPKEKLVPEDLLILSCKEDYTICFPFLAEGALIYDSELLLNGIVIQKLEYERYQLFKDLP